MATLEGQLDAMTRRNRDGSYKTQGDRRRILHLLARQLREVGFGQVRAQELKGRHRNRLLALWQEQGISADTIDNRMAVLRWWAEKIGKPEIFARSNRVYGYRAHPRPRPGQVSKAKVLTDEQREQVVDPYIQMSLRLIQAYGLRRKESLMLCPHEADGGEVLRLLHNWAKNGRPRVIPIVEERQREVLEAAKALVEEEGASLIPPEQTYIEQERRFDGWVQRIGLGGAHGLRHAWAQARYGVLSGMACPLLGGPLWDGMSREERRADQAARQGLTRELGHERPAQVATYIGSNRPRVPASMSAAR
jgi:integrase